MHKQSAVSRRGKQNALEVKVQLNFHSSLVDGVCKHVQNVGIYFDLDRICGPKAILIPWSFLICMLDPLILLWSPLQLEVQATIVVTIPWLKAWANTYQSGLYQMPPTHPAFYQSPCQMPLSAQEGDSGRLDWQVHNTKEHIYCHEYLYA